MVTVTPVSLPVQDLEHFFRFAPSAVLLADFGIGHLEILLDHKGRRIGCFTGFIPSQVVSVCECIVRVEQQLEMVRDGSVFDELLGAFRQIRRRARVDQQNLSPCGQSESSQTSFRAFNTAWTKSSETSTAGGSSIRVIDFWLALIVAL